ncbi:carboxypeptidase-like regulatory domain-containing protein [Aquimarina sp. 2304DJ70-9]|uniref:carboxypeptidase-like regulatory domain-containing protein n=1 Tax=Aquimarina penaris TaxID=3231044 RepID=UPI0034626B75
MRNRGFLFLVFFLVTTLMSYSQYEVLIDAFVLHQETNKPIPYINVGFVDKEVGTVTNKNGRFYLRYDEDEIQDNDIIKFSGIGYQSTSFRYKQLFEALKKDNKIFLKHITKDQINVIDPPVEENKIDSIGYITYDSDQLAYWRGKDILGSEIGAFIKSRKKNTKLLKLKFNVVENTADSLLVRVNIYENDKGRPGNNIVKNTIFHTISRKTGEESIDLSKYNIIVNHDFIASIELVNVFGNDMKFAITGSPIGHSFVKKVSHDRWTVNENKGIAFKLHTSNTLKDYEPDEFEKPKHITIYWDTSLSMKDKNLEKEVQFLEEYFSKIINVSVDLVTFSSSFAQTKSFIIKNGSSKTLISNLKKVRYNGATNFSKFFHENKSTDHYLVFTDGNYNFGKPKFDHDKPVFYISSKMDANHTELQQAAYFTGGEYVNLLKTEPQEALEYVFSRWKDPLLYKIKESSELIEGVVLYENTPVEGCRVSVKGTHIEAVTDSNGNFTIKAMPNQVLSFHHFSMKSKEMHLNGLQRVKIELKPKYEKLNEVTLTKKKDDKPEEQVNLGNKKVNKYKMGFTTYMINKEEFPASSLHLTDLLRKKFPGVQVFGFGDAAKVIVRGRNTILGDNDPLYVVDGAIQVAPPYYLLPAMLESITLIPGLSGTIMYGGRARNGVFVIETNLMNSAGTDNKSKNTLLVKGNDYNESTFLLNPNKNKPEYLDVLWNSTSYIEAQEIFYTLRETHMQEVTFYVFCSEYFKRWNPNFSLEIISNLAEIAEDNYGVLRTLAFLLEERGNVQQAVMVYEDLFNLRPDFAQSYLDLARIYKENKEYAKAFDVYKRILKEYLDIEELVEVRKQVKSEIQHLLNHHRLHIPYTNIPAKHLVVKGVPIRIVFDWNDPQAEFEFQFVSPKKKYEKWSHRFHDNNQLLIDEVRHGIVSKEFIVDDSTPGEWIVNVQSLDDVSSLKPTFMKYTIYRNYGLADETKTIKFIKLYNQKEKVTLDKFSI